MRATSAPDAPACSPAGRMSDPLDITEAEAAGLSELAQLDLAMARRFAARAEAAEDPAVANDLARSYERMARSYRRTLALKARLLRDRAEARKAAPKPKPGGAAVARRLHDLRGALVRVAWDEAEGEEGEKDPRLFGWYAEEIEGALHEEVLQDSFCDEALDDHVARLGRDLGYPLDRVLAWRDLPDPPPEAFADPDEPEDESELYPLRQSSA